MDHKPTPKQKDNLSVGQLIEKFQKIKEERFKTKTKRVVTTFGNPKTSPSQKDAFIQQDLIIAEAQFKNLKAAEQVQAESRRVMAVPSIFHPFKETLPTTTDSLEDIPEEVAKEESDPLPPGKRFTMSVVLQEYSKKDIKDLEKADVSKLVSKPLIEEVVEEKPDPKEWMTGNYLRGYYSNIWERSGGSSIAEDKAKAYKQLQDSEQDTKDKDSGVQVKRTKRSKGASKFKPFATKSTR